ncbi:MAG TPA: aminoglycoside phosphotransferase family protein, partial [Candidatus Limnocylindrales bacterium]|nr:aminoglycoside phosphotransferase family protein [Candidatus Limnocylindrales bacterium]
MTDQPTRRSRVPPAFPALAYLYQPADPALKTAVLEVDDRWSFPERPPTDVDVVLWGRLPLNRRPSARSIEYASRRELAIQRLRSRPPAGFRLVALHRLPPVRRPGAIRRRVRTVSLGGVLAELVRRDAAIGDGQRRVIDAVVRAAGSDTPHPRVRPSGDGSALVRLTLGDGTRAEMRVAKAGIPKDPARGHAALTALAEAGVELVPRPLGLGLTAGAAWSTETVVPGRHVHALEGPLLSDVIAFLTTLPAASGEATAITDHLTEVADFFPEHAAALRDIAEAGRRWSAGLPAMLIHGDLWLNNLFATDGRLSAVFDWDTWHPAGLPGTDLLNLLAADARSRGHGDIGELLSSDYWRRPEVAAAFEAYFRARGEPVPDHVGQAAIA